MATITLVEVLDKLAAGMAKWNTNCTNLNSGLAATDAALATHVGVGVGSGHAAYDAYDARIDALEAAASKISFSSWCDGATSPYIPLPVGTITKVSIVLNNNTVVSATLTTAVSSADTLFFYTIGAYGAINLTLGATVIDTLSGGTQVPAYMTISMTV